jgi:GWxTD domain-containing protein
MIIFLFLQIEWQAVNRPYSESLQELLIHYTIPTHDLQFIVEDSNFYAHYESQLKVYAKDGSQVTGDYWQRRVLEDSLDIHDSLKIIIPKTSRYYNLRIIDLNAGELINITEKIIPINYLANISWLVTDDTVNISFTVLNQNGDIDSVYSSIKKITDAKAVHVGTYDDSLSLYIEELSNDMYTLKFMLFSMGEKIDELEIPITISRSFFLDDQSWFLKVDQLVYIATPSEMSQLKSAERVQRDSLWHTFWKEYDPTPHTVYNEKEVDYFSRIEYCEKNFSFGDRGWRSDRAKIYMRYGPPDEIHARPYETGSLPYLIWFYYRINRKFIFVDEHGFGEYLVVNMQGSTI